MVDRTTWENLERLFSEYEAQQRLHELTGALHAAKLLPPHAAFGGAADGTQFVRLGAFAAKLVELDCAYQLADARRLLEQSRPLANATADAKPAGDFERRMLSYWNTAAGRVWYRLRDYPRALEFFKRSEEFASGDVGWALSCRSDYIRCEMEIARAFGKEDDAKKEARSELAKALKIGLDLRDENPVGMAEALTNRLTGGLDDAALGALNLFHNLCDAGGGPDVRNRRLVVDAARTSGERYRSYQIEQGILLAYESQSFKGVSEEEVVASLHRLKHCGLPRVRWMALQREAAWQRAKGCGKVSLGIYQALLQELRAARDSEGADYFHHEVHHYVLTLVSRHHVSEETEPWFDDESIQLVESLRSLVSLPYYKAAFARWSKPRLDQVTARIARRISIPENVTDLEKLVGVVEMGACRELLDVLASRPGSAPLGKSAAPAAAATLDTVADEQRGTAIQERATESQDTTGRVSVPADACLAAPTLKPAAVEEGETAIQERANKYQDRTGRVAIPAVPHDPEILYRTQQESLSSGTLFLRYASIGSDQWGVVRVWKGNAKWIELTKQHSAITELIDKDWSSIEFSPDLQICEQIWTALFETALKPLDGGNTEHQVDMKSVKRVVIVPADRLWRVPFQAAMIPATQGGESKPLAAAVEVVLATSLTAYVTHGRSRLDRFAINPNDDFVAVNALSLDEQKKHPRAFNWVETLRGGAKVTQVVVPACGDTSSDGLLDSIAEKRPEYLYWLGHCTKYGRGDSVEVALLGPNLRPVLTTYDLLDRKVLARNKLCVLAACMTAAADNGSDGELRGFIRALQGAGAGAIMLSHWKISVNSGPSYVQGLFKKLLSKRGKVGTRGKGGVSVAAAMLAMNKQLWKEDENQAKPMQALPFCLIL